VAGTRKVSISLQDDLLEKADALARKRGIKRSELIASFVLAGLGRRAS
jgi:metal-responsive CopG/Arc/MetJ family transcriptional regulator